MRSGWRRTTQPLATESVELAGRRTRSRTRCTSPVGAAWVWRIQAAPSCALISDIADADVARRTADVRGYTHHGPQPPCYACPHYIRREWDIFGALSCANRWRGRRKKNFGGARAARPVESLVHG